jgi:hypothetical protein
MTTNDIATQLETARAAKESILARRVSGSRLFPQYASEADRLESVRLAAEITRLEQAQFDVADAEFPTFDEEV